MKFKLLFIAMTFTGLSFVPGSGFLSEQKKNSRVALAFTEKEPALRSRLHELDLTPEQVQILIVAFKEEKELELYVRGDASSKYRKLTTYDICAISGTPGPKRMQDDLQTPEGFYTINRFNPNSSYYLSLGINYPNASDRIFSNGRNPGGDIYIHGECVTIGCLPMTNDKIKEIYLMAVHARDNGQQNIPVYIFPCRMSEAGLAGIKKQYQAHPDLMRFWDNLKAGYDIFNKNFEEMTITVDKKTGRYLIRKTALISPASSP
jgi:murein L,D-transpeptidase YafK